MKTTHLLSIMLVIGSLAGLATLSGCDTIQADNENRSSARPDKLIIGLKPPEEGDRTLEQIQTITNYLSKKLGMEVEHLEVSNGAAMIEAMRANKIHLGSGGTFTYLVAADKARAEALVTTGTLDGEPNYYRSCLITYPGSGIRTIEDVIKKSGQITLSWAFPTSTSGHLVPRFFLQQRGIFPKDFKEILVATDHAASFFTVLSHKVDVAAVTYTTYQRFLKEGRFKEKDIHVVWLSEPITPSPVFVKRDLDAGLKKKIQQAYLDMPKEDPEAYRILRRQYSYNLKYIPVDDSFYEPFRDMANMVEGLELLD